MKKLYLVGSGPGDESLLTEMAKSTLEAANRILNTREMRLEELFSALGDPVSEVTVVLVSGDCGFYSVAKTIIKEFSSLYDIEVVPGIGSVQYFSAKIKTSYDDAALISLHGRAGNIVSKVAYNKKVYALTGGEQNANDVCRTLSKYGLGEVKVSVGEKLSFPEERIMTGSAAELKDMDFDNLSIMYIENPSAVSPHTILGDSDFIRGDVPMTKEEVRWLSMPKLGVSPGDIVFDIGAGTGSVAVELARKVYDGFVYAIEVKEEACALIRENADRHGAFNMEIVHGIAPDALSGLPAPDKAFIGGSSGNMDGIVNRLLSLNPDVKITANAITLQTLQESINVSEKYELKNTEIICVNIAKQKKAGDYDMMIAQNPVHIISMSK